jgi:hypothetical protein
VWANEIEAKWKLAANKETFAAYHPTLAAFRCCFDEFEMKNDPACGASEENSRKFNTQKTRKTTQKWRGSDSSAFTHKVLDAKFVSSCFN